MSNDLDFDLESTVMKLVPSSEQIDLTTWTWGEGFDEGIGGMLMKGISAQVTEVLREVFREDPPRLHFPFVWTNDGKVEDGETPVRDPATVYVDLPLSQSEDPCSYGISLESCVNDVIALHRAGGDKNRKVEDKDGREICGALAARLRELAQKLDDACMVPA